MGLLERPIYRSQEPGVFKDPNKAAVKRHADEADSKLKAISRTQEQSSCERIQP